MKQAAFWLPAAILAGMTAVQDLPPEVLLLARVKSHFREELEILTRISCLETVHREFQKPNGKMCPLDTVRLEVITDGKQELFASPSGRNFSEQRPISYVGSGTLGDGIFGPYLKKVLLSSASYSRYHGEETIGGRVLARFDYRLSLPWSGEIIRTPEGSGEVGLHGSYWVDPQTYDVVRLELNADDIPPTLPIAEAVTVINYARNKLNGGLAVLLPETADFRMVKSSGAVHHNRIEFTHCRVFKAESVINFRDADSAGEATRFAVSSVDDTLRKLPPGLQIVVGLRSRIGADTAVGALIDGVVAENAELKHAVIVPAGSQVRGRVRRLERYSDPFPYFVVGLEFTELEVHGIRHLFYADPVSLQPAPGVETTLNTRNETDTSDIGFGGKRVRGFHENLNLPGLPGVAVFFFKGSKLDLPSGFRTVWKTQAVEP